MKNPKEAIKSVEFHLNDMVHLLSDDKAFELLTGKHGKHMRDMYVAGTKMSLTILFSIRNDNIK